jgi:uncharacterized protein YbjT (DUF2867 family)
MYVVAGVSGHTGAAVADALLGAGKAVRVLVRQEAKAGPWQRRRAEVAVASLDDPASLGAALEGARGAYLLSPQDPRSGDPVGDGWRIADAIARAVTSSGLGHLVMLSAIRAGDEQVQGLPRTLRAAESRLAEVPGAVTFVRAAFLLENWAAVLPATAAGKLPTFLRPDRSLPMVAARDVGAVAAAALLEGPAEGQVRSRQIVEVVGPREFSPDDVAAALATLLRRPVQAEALPLAALPAVLAGAGASSAFAEQVRLMYASMEQGGHAPGAAGARLCRGGTDLVSFFEPLLATLPSGPS